MFVAGYFLSALARVLDLALNIYMWVIIIRAIVSWVSPDPYNPIVQFLYRATEPLLQPIRRLLPPTWGIDFSPLVLILGIIFLQNFLVAALLRMAWELR
ncbi:MAG: YggT family protein [Candidatus Methylomirabilales bacterium]